MNTRSRVRGAAGRWGAKASRRLVASSAVLLGLGSAVTAQEARDAARGPNGAPAQEATEATEATGTTEATEATGTTEATEATGTTEATEATGGIEATDPVRSDTQWPVTSTMEEFVVGNAQFVLMHELAHLVIDEKRVPILGSEESAADYIAAMMLIRPRTTPPEGADALIDVAVNTADGFATAWQRSARLGAEVPYWNSHSLTVQRFSTLACLLYGSNPERFAELLDRMEMPEPRARSCITEYEKAAYAIDWLFDNYARRESDPRGAPIEIEFEAPPTRTSERMLSAIRRQGFIERTFAFFDEAVALEDPARFVMRSCRQPQAMWVPERRELVFCYELPDAYAAMSLERNVEQPESPRLTRPR